MPNNQINQDDINKAVWSACDTFRGTISPDVYKDFVLTMLFLKYISDVYKNEYDKLVAQFGDQPELINAMMAKQRLSYLTELVFGIYMSNVIKQVMGNASIKLYTRLKKPTAPNLKTYSRISVLTPTN